MCVQLLDNLKIISFIILIFLSKPIGNAMASSPIPVSTLSACLTLMFTNVVALSPMKTENLVLARKEINALQLVVNGSIQGVSGDVDPEGETQLPSRMEETERERGYSSQRRYGTIQYSIHHNKLTPRIKSLWLAFMRDSILTTNVT